MNKSRLINESTYNKYTKLDNLDNLSFPLLVSSKKYLESIKEHPIMYIDQETNGWINDDDISIHTIDDVEDNYDSFLINYKTSKSIY